MSAPPTTPHSKPPFQPTTPATTRLAKPAIQSSPHYTTTRRHSLYGVEDRVIIDPGSLIWKVGFSGEGRPRDVFHAGGASVTSLWNLRRAIDPTERGEEDRILEIKLQSCLRSVFHDSLLTDPKARKVIIIESPLLPLHIKDIIAKVLFENQVPSVSFAPSHLLSLFAVGRITGLVLDCGHLESIALPIFAARPLFPQLRTTPLAGNRLTSHLRALLLMFGTYFPPPSSLNTATSIPSINRGTRVPEEVLTDAVIEDIKTRCCFVGGTIDNSLPKEPFTTEHAPELDPPPSDSVLSESEASHSDIVMSHHTGSDVSSEDNLTNESQFQRLASMYIRRSTATDLQMTVTPPLAEQSKTGLGTLIIPGWIRERASEVLFEGGDVDESSVAEVILDSLLKVPVDLRKTLASSILVSGGTAMLPGFIPRLHSEILRELTSRPATRSKHSPPQYDKYACIRPLMPYFAILNNPSPPSSASARAAANAGKAPAFAPTTMAWVGGSLAGSLKTGGVEVPREKWDEGDSKRDGEGDINDETPIRPLNIIPDWTRTPLPA